MRRGALIALCKRQTTLRSKRWRARAIQQHWGLAKNRPGTKWSISSSNCLCVRGSVCPSICPRILHGVFTHHCSLMQQATVNMRLSLTPAGVSCRWWAHTSTATSLASKSTCARCPAAAMMPRLWQFSRYVCIFTQNRVHLGTSQRSAQHVRGFHLICMSCACCSRVTLMLLPHRCLKHADCHDFFIQNESPSQHPCRDCLHRLRAVSPSEVHRSSRSHLFSPACDMTAS